MIKIKRETVDDDSSKRDDTSPNLNFSRFGSRKKEVKHDCPDSQTFDDKKGKCVFKSDKEDMNSNIDTNTSLQPNADAMQNKVQQVNKRAPQSVNDREVVGIKTKPFKRQDFTKGKNQATNI